MQERPVSAQPMLEEVLVTARKRTESLMDAPLSVTAVSGRNLDDQGITNLAQLSSQVPGLSLGVTAQTTSIYIRGVGSAINKGFEQSAGMYIDGVYQARSRQFSLGMVDVEQIEVLRGPQSILFGKNTIAGAIKMESASPILGDGFTGSVTADFEPDQDTTRGTVVLSGDLTDSVAGRVAMRYQESDGFVDNNLRNADEKNTEDKMGRGTLVWAPTDTVQVTGKLTYIDMEGDGNATVNAVADPSLLATFGQPGNSLGVTSVMGSIAAFQVPGYQESSGSKEYDSWLANESFFPGGTDQDSLESTQASLKVYWEISDYSLTSLTGYTDFDEKRQQDVDFHGGNVAGNLETEDLELFSQEFRIASNYEGRLNFVAGLYYEEQDGSIGHSDTVLDGSLGGVFGALPANSLSPALPPGLSLGDLGINSLWNGTVFTSLNPAFAPLIGAELDTIVRVPNNDIDNDTLAVFFEVNYDITDSLTLELGGRYSDAPCTIFQTAATPSGETCRQDLQGEAGPFAPEWSGTVFAQYEYQLGHNLMLSLRGDASYKDDYYTDADLDPNSLQESFWKYNARIGLSDQGGRWEVAAYGRNLTDEATYSFTVDAPLSAGIYANGIEEPRVYGLQARYNFQ